MKKLLNVYSSLKKDRSLFSLSFLIEFAWNLLLIELLDRLMAYSAQSDLCLFSKTSVLFCIGAVIFVLLVFSDQYFFRKLKGVGELKLQEYTYGCFLKNLSSVQFQKAGDLVSAVNRNTEVISQWMSTGVVNTILQTFLLLAYLLILLLHNAVVTMITVFIIIVIFLLSKLYAQKEAAYTAEKQTRYSEINSKLLDTLNNRNLIYALNNEAFFSNKLKTFHDQISQSVLVPLSRYTALRNAMLTFMINTLPVIVLVSTILLAKLGKATGSDAITMMLIAQKLNGPIILLTDLIADQKKASEMYAKSKSLYTEKADEHRGNLMQDFEEMRVEIHEFQYTDCGDKILVGLQFQFKRGDLVLIKAASGKGKTTLIELMSRLIPADGLCGSIKYNNQLISNFDLKDYHCRVLLVERTPALIDGTLYENLVLGDIFYPEWIEEIIHVCVLQDFIQGRDQSYQIQGDGSNISGGERQRIGLARMLLRRPEIILLDEVTSALDSKTKSVLVNRLLTFAQKYNMTIIAVSHDDSFDAHCTSLKITLQAGRPYIQTPFLRCKMLVGIVQNPL